MKKKEEKVKTAKKTGVDKTNDTAKKKSPFQVNVNTMTKAAFIKKAKELTNGNLSALVRYAVINLNPTAKQKKELAALS